MTPFSDTEKEGDLVATIRRVLGGENPNDVLQDKPSTNSTKVEVEDEDDKQSDTEKPTKIDGRSRDYRNTVSRIQNRQKKKSSDGIDGRSRSYKATLKRINTRRNRGGK